MNKIRILAVIDILLILIMFGLMVAALWLGRYNLFFISGGVLVAVIICGIAVIAAKKKMTPEENQEEKQ